MLTYRDYVVEAYRRRDAMERAEHHRLIRSIHTGRTQGPHYGRRFLSSIGVFFIVLGKRLRTSSIQTDPTVVVR